MKTSKAYAKEVLSLWADKTPFFNSSMTEAQFESALRCAGFTTPAAIAITMAMVIAGAKFAS